MGDSIVIIESPRILKTELVQSTSFFLNLQLMPQSFLLTGSGRLRASVKQIAHKKQLEFHISIRISSAACSNPRASLVRCSSCCQADC
jgi:hypothetical protein